MPDVSFVNLLVVAAIAPAAPMVVGFFRRMRIPAVVLEIVAGIAVGPHGFGWVKVDLPIQILALMGLAFLLFLAGLEIDIVRLRGRLIRLAGLGFLVTVGLGIAAGYAFDATGVVKSPLLVGIALMATSLGLVVPVLKDAGQAETELGQREPSRLRCTPEHPAGAAPWLPACCRPRHCPSWSQRRRSVSPSARSRR